MSIATSARIAVSVLALTIAVQHMEAQQQAAVPPAKAAPAVRVPKSVLERYVGEYQFLPKVTIVVRIKGDTILTGQAAGGPEMNLLPISETRFKPGSPNIPLDVEFVIDQTGKVTQVLRQGTHEMRAVRKPKP